MQDILKEIFDNDDLYDNYRTMWNDALGKLQSCKKLYEIENFMDLDMALEQTHEAKIALDYSINLLERILVNKGIELKWLKEDLKTEKLRIELSFDSSNKKLREDSTVKSYERRRERSIGINIKSKVEQEINLESDIEITKMELKNAGRTRENISEVYMSIKKKYDALIRFVNV